MKANKIIAKILIMTMVFTIITSSLAYGEGQINKEETVYVNLDNNGKAIEKISSIWLYSDSPLKNVEDKSILKDVVNVIPTLKDIGKWDKEKQQVIIMTLIDRITVYNDRIVIDWMF